MSTLTENLQTIYEVKQEIKEVLGTSSDIFTEYPDLIEAAIGQGGGSSIPESIWLTPNDLSPIFNDPRSYQFPLHLDCVQLFISSDFNVIRDNEENMTSVEFMSDYGISGGQVSIKVIVNDNIDGDLSSAEGLEEAIDEHANDIYGEIRPYLTDCTLSVGDGENEDYILEGKIYAWNLNDDVWGVGEITENGFHLNTDGYVGFNVNVSPALDNMVFNQNKVYYAYSYGIDGWSTVTVNVPAGSAYFYVVRNPEEENEEILPFVDHTAEEGYPCFSYNFGNFVYTQEEGAQQVIFPINNDTEGVDKTAIRTKIESPLFTTLGQDPVDIYAPGPATIETSNDSEEAQIIIGQVGPEGAADAPAVYITRSISNLNYYIEKPNSSSEWTGRWEWQ